MPGVDRHLSAARERELSFGCGARNRRPRADRGAAANFNRGHEFGARADKGVVPDHRAEFVHTVVVAGNGA